MMKQKIDYESPELQHIYVAEDSIYCTSTSDTSVDEMVVVNEEW